MLSIATFYICNLGHAQTLQISRGLEPNNYFSTGNEIKKKKMSSLLFLESTNIFL